MEKELTNIRAWLGQGSLNIFGMPFAGKDTQGQALADLLETELLGGGKILRESTIPPHVKKIMEAGELIPIDEFLRIVPPYLSQKQFQGKPLVLSAFGRWDGEQEGVVQATAAANHPIKAAILLTVSEDVARQRLALAPHEGDRGARADDTEDIFLVRLHEYQQKTLPVIDYYRAKGLLVEVDGTHSAIEVTGDILAQLAKHASDKPA